MEDLLTEVNDATALTILGALLSAIESEQEAKE
jgi:hypothetical protein